MIQFQRLAQTVREGLSTPEHYSDWLAGLQDGNAVLLQEFLPPTSALGLPFECWKYTKGHVVRDNRGFVFRDLKGHDPIRPDGQACFYNDTESELGRVFPIRLVRPHSDFDFSGTCHAHAPIYEPEYLGCYRHVFVDAYGADHGGLTREIRRKYRRSYLGRDIEDGELVIAFSSERAPVEALVYHPIYSEYLRP